MVVALLLIGLAGMRLASLAGPQEPAAAAPPPQAPTFRLDASYVRVDAYPTLDGKVVADLTAADFELLEDGVPQRIEQFERIALPRATTREERRDPASIAEGREQAADPRRRVFVIFLDTGMTTTEGSYRARKPIVDMLENLIGPDDLFAVVTPEMDPRQLTFGRRTEGLDAMLEKHWTWGRRDSLVRLDPEEQAIEDCFPENTSAVKCYGPDGQVIVQPAYAYRGVAIQLIERRSETMALNALNDLVGVLGAVREERKAVVAITQGWFRFQSKPELTRLQECDSAPQPRIGVGPDGRIVTDKDAARRNNTRAESECQQLAIQYALVDNEALFRDIIERANRFNVSFYPFDTRGLAAFDRSIGARDRSIRDDPGEWPNRRDPRVDNPMTRSPLDEDRESLNRRIDGMRELADSTDGLAVVNTNDLAAGARRIVDDLSTYYLLGYYSTNTTLDGKWRKITVRVKRPGVDVRARRGYRAVRAEDMPTTMVGTAAGGAGGAGAGDPTLAMNEALGALAGLNTAVPWRSRAAYRVAGEGPAREGRFWIASELEPQTLRESGWATGGTLTATLTLPDGTPVGEGTGELPPGNRFVEIATTAPLAGAEEVVVRLRLRPAEGGLPLTDSLRVALGSPLSARVFRAGPLTAQRFVATADQRFRRNERVRVSLPLAGGSEPVSAALVDRAGHVLDRLPVAARVDTIEGDPWAVAEVTLAPLGPGDYALRFEVGRDARVQRVFTGIRVVN